MGELTSNQRIAKNTVFLYIRMFLTMAIGLYTSRVVLQALGVDDFGIYNVVGGIVVLLGFLNQSLSVGAQRFITFALGKEDINLQRLTFSSTLFLYLMLSVGVLILAETVGLYILNHYLIIPQERLYAANIVYQFSVLTCIISFFQVPFNASIIAYERMGFYAYVSIGEVVVKLFLVVLISHVNYDRLQLYAFFMAVTQLIVFMCYLVYGRVRCNCILSLKRDRGILKSLFSFCGWNIMGALSGALSTQGVNMILNAFFGPVCNAARGISVQVNNAVSQFAGSFQTAATPQITKLYAKGNNFELFELITINSKLSFILMSFIIVPFILEMPYILHIWLGVYPDDTILFCRIVLIQSLIFSLDRPFVSGIYATGEMKIANITSGLLYLLVFPIGYFLLKIGAPAFSVFLVALIMQPIILIVDIIIFRRFTGYCISSFFSNVLPRCIIVFVISFLATCLIYNVIDPGLFRLIVVLFCSFIFTLCLSFFVGLNTVERKKVLSYLQRLVRKKYNYEY